MASEHDPLPRRLAWRSAVSLALIVGELAGGALFVLTLVLVMKGGENAGTNLGLLANYLPGFDITVPGALIGAVKAVLFGALLALLPAWIYYHGVLTHIDARRRRYGDQDLLHVTAKLHVPTFAAAGGVFCAILLVVATLWLLARHRPGEPLGPHLSLLSHYLPGFEVSLMGALIG